MLDLVRSRTEHPVQLADWSQTDDGSTTVCGCCGWSGRLGECQTMQDAHQKHYACAQCGMPLLVRVYPKVVAIQSILKERPRKLDQYRLVVG